LRCKTSQILSLGNTDDPGRVTAGESSGNVDDDDDDDDCAA
jgi:hypothetical protein